MTAAGVSLSFLLKEVCMVSWCTCVSLRDHFPAGREGGGGRGGGEERGGEGERREEGRGREGGRGRGEGGEERGKEEEEEQGSEGGERESKEEERWEGEEGGGQGGRGGTRSLHYKSKDSCYGNKEHIEGSPILGTDKNKSNKPLAFSSSDFFLASVMSCAYVGFTAGASFRFTLDEGSDFAVPVAAESSCREPASSSRCGGNSIISGLVSWERSDSEAPMSALCSSLFLLSTPTSSEVWDSSSSGEAVGAGWTLDW